MQPHLGKCFEGISKLSFDDKLIIHGMVSVEGEKVPFKDTLDPNAANGMVEKWLLQVEGMMKESVCTLKRLEIIVSIVYLTTNAKKIISTFVQVYTVPARKHIQGKCHQNGAHNRSKCS